MAEARRLKELAAGVISLADIPEGALVVALSGGADSAALLWTCVRLGREVKAVHVHHGLAASDLMEAAAKSVAAQLDVPLTISRVEVGTGASPENLAREARYRALAEAATAGEWILTAHTSDDQAETVIDHLLRASGLDGLGGIPARRPPFARPFLAVARSETRELATFAALPWRDDPVNEDPDPLRNRIRRCLIPALEAAYNPRMRQSLATTAALVARDTQHLEELVGKAPVIDTGAGAEVAAAVISTAPPAVAARIARRLLTVAGLPAASSGSVDGVLAVATGAAPSYEPGGGLVVSRRGAIVVADRWAVPPGISAVLLEAPGSTDYHRWRFQAIVTHTAPPAMPIGAAWMIADAAAVTPVQIEPASAHPHLLDRLPAGGVPASERSTYPVLVGPGGPIWLPMVRRLEAGWVEPRTERYLVVVARVNRTCRR